MGFILYQKLTGKRRRRRSVEEEHFDPWDLLDNIQTIALHGNYLHTLNYTLYNKDIASVENKFWCFPSKC